MVFIICNALFQSPTFIRVSWFSSVSDMDLQPFQFRTSLPQPRLVYGSDQPFLKPLVSPGTELDRMPGITICDALQVAKQNIGIICGRW